jgi:hypothetical protein
LRLTEASKQFGQIEHLVASEPLRDYGLSYETLRGKAVKVLASRGVIGGCMIWHSFRYNVRKQWYFAPHFHVLGFILGGAGRCRKCEKACDKLGCDGFFAREARGYGLDGWIVKVFGERITVGGTAWYQLNHASIDVTKKRFHVATWFGVCSYRKLRLTVKRKKAICPICQEELYRIWYSGGRSFVEDRASPDYERDTIEDLVEGGEVVWHAWHRENQ